MVSVLHDDAIGNGRPALAKITADIPSYHATLKTAGASRSRPASDT